MKTPFYLLFLGILFQIENKWFAGTFGSWEQVSGFPLCVIFLAIHQ
jgi:hypothetical protein